MDDLRDRERPQDQTREIEIQPEATRTYADVDRRSIVGRWAKVMVLVVVLAGLVVVVIRFTNSESSSGGGHKPPSGSSGAGFTVEQQAEFSRCMREQGVDVSDPVVGAGGRVEAMQPGPGVDVNGPAFQGALSTCGARLAPTAGQPSGGHP